MIYDGFAKKRGCCVALISRRCDVQLRESFENHAPSARRTFLDPAPPRFAAKTKLALKRSNNRLCGRCAAGAGAPKNLQCALPEDDFRALKMSLRTSHSFGTRALCLRPLYEAQGPIKVGWLMVPKRTFVELLGRPSRRGKVSAKRPLPIVRARGAILGSGAAEPP